MKKNKLHLTVAEWQLAIRGLNELRTNLINEGRCTDFVNELLMKVINAPSKTTITWPTITV